MQDLAHKPTIVTPLDLILQYIVDVDFGGLTILLVVIDRSFRDRPKCLCREIICCDPLTQDTGKVVTVTQSSQYVVF
jgi:hypothetical protein